MVSILGVLVVVVGPVGLNKLVVSCAKWAVGGNGCLKELLSTKGSELWLSLTDLVESNAFVNSKFLYFQNL